MRNLRGRPKPEGAAQALNSQNKPHVFTPDCYVLVCTLDLASESGTMATGMVVLFIVAVQQDEVGVCLDAKALVRSQGEMLEN